MSRIRPLLLIGSALMLAACGRSEPPAQTVPAPVAEAPPVVAPASAMPSATAQATLDQVAGSGAAGELAFVVENGAVRVTGVFTGLSPGATHAFHVHETGDCSAPDATSAGGHFNPDGQPHGSREAGGPHHAGDIPNQQADDQGVAAVDQLLEGLEIASGGEFDIIGKAVIVHAGTDDYSTQPTGDAGGRIACGVITAGTLAPSEDDAAP